MSLLIDLQPGAGTVLVVGGGTIATRKVRSLHAGGFDVVVIAPDVSAELVECGARIETRRFDEADVSGRRWSLILACTDSRELNRRVGELARAIGVPVLVADSQVESTFFSPAVYREGDLQLAVSTGGADPSLAKSIRERVVAALGTGWGERLAAARRSRDQKLGRSGDDE